MTVVVPGNSQLTDIYTDIEYKLTQDQTCGDPPEPAPYCTYTQASMAIQNNTCNTTTGPLSCNPANPPYTGTCTTDSNLVPWASSIHINQYFPDYFSCIAPSCPDFQIPFTLKNQDSICGDVCGYLCARGNIWRTTVYACQVEGYITPDNSTVCAGQPDTFTAHPDCGVPPYHYAWSTDGGNTYTTIHNSPNFVVYPQQNMIVSCVIYDSCDKFWLANTSNISMLPTPTADAGLDQYINLGGNIVIGGSPTASPPNTTIQWTGENPTVQSWLSSTTAPNPTVTIPQGTVDSFYYVVTVSNSNCYRTDTVWVYSLPTGINNLSDDGNAIAIIPNPSNGNFEIRFSSIENAPQSAMRVIDNAGRLISTRQISVSTGKNIYSFHPENKLATGEYWIQITVGKTVLNKKFIVL